MMTLFIGGVWDGRHIEVADYRPFVIAPVHKPFSVAFQYQCGPLKDDCETHVYKRVSFCGERQDHQLYIHEPISGDEAFQKLVDNYSPQSAVDGKIRSGIQSETARLVVEVLRLKCQLQILKNQVHPQENNN